MVLLEDSDYFMSLALLSAMRSKDPVTQVGACIVDEGGRVVSLGYNGMPVGCDDDFMPWSKTSANRLQTKYPYVCHAEANAVVNVGSEPLDGCSMYVTLFPCNVCAKLILKSGIRRLFYIAEKPAKAEMKASRRMLELGNVVCEKFITSRPECNCMDGSKIFHTERNSIETPSDDEIISISSDTVSTDTDDVSEKATVISYGSSSGWCSDTEGSSAAPVTSSSSPTFSFGQSDSAKSGQEVCDVCQDGGKLILCDGCGASFHTFCHFPRVVAIPKGPWYCSVCSMQSTSTCELPGRRTAKRASAESSASSSSSLDSTPTKTDRLEAMLNRTADGMRSRNAMEFCSELSPVVGSIYSDDEEEEDEVEEEDDDDDEIDDDEDDDDYDGDVDSSSNQDGVETLFLGSQEEGCLYCKKSSPRANLIDCSYCKSVFHEDCLLPLLVKRSEENWMCPMHTKFIAKKFIKSKPCRKNRLVKWLSANARHFAIDSVVDLMFQSSPKNKQPEPPFYVAPEEVQSFNSTQAKPKEVCYYKTVASWCRDVLQLLQFVRKQDEQLEEKLNGPIAFVDCSLENDGDTDEEVIKIFDRYAVVRALLDRFKGPHRFNLSSITVDSRDYDASFPVLATLKLWYSCIEIIVQKPWLSLGTMMGESHLNLTNYCSCSRLSPVHAVLFFDEESSQFFLFCQSIHGIIVDGVCYGRKMPDIQAVKSPDRCDNRLIDLIAKKISLFECTCADKFKFHESVDEPVALKSGSRMDALIDVVNKLQDVVYALGCSCIQLPQIVVVGAQSSGKSSIIENIVGRDFLPRGPGIVTRRPLILQLISRKKVDDPKESGSLDDFPDEVQFYHTGDRVFNDFDEVRDEIERETDRLLGSNKAISKQPIIMKMFSTKVVNLTLVDLPGIIKIPVGDQPTDIEAEIDEMVMSYIRSDSSIILAITAANQDFATSDSLKLARKVDPQGDRTLAVVTKLDLMDYGTDATDLLLGKLIPIKLGIIGVVNRSNQDTVNRKLLMRHIHKCLPQLRAQIAIKISEHQQMLKAYGKPVLDKAQTLLQIITHFASSYVATVEGTAKNIETSELCGGARICYIFHETFRNALERINPMDNLKSTDILTAIRNATGPRPVLFIPEVAFELLVKRQIQRLLEPSLRCVDLVHKEMQRMVHHCEQGVHQEMTRFPKLCERIVEVVSSVLYRQVPVTNQMVESLLSIQLAYINTKHPDFDGVALESLLCCQLEEHRSAASTAPEDHRTTKIPMEQMNLQPGITFAEDTSGYDGVISANALPQGSLASRATSALNDLFWRRREDKEELSNIAKKEEVEKCMLSPREQRDCKIVEELVLSYFSIARKQIQDLVPKTIMHLLVNCVKDNLQSELVKELYHPAMLDVLLEESEQITRQREGIARTLECLQKANQIIAEVRELRLS
uniref:Probable deoxycytidylate deaminase n=1 Tax=Trichuris muris TaxID=70415 RepID=A0A5S6R116_TRIMR